MREIKFRVWDKKNKEWAHSCGRVVGITRDGNVVFQYPSHTDLEFDDGKLYEIAQYTGLKDKNGKEIYEGDIVRATQVDDYTLHDKPFEIVTRVTITIDTEISGYGMGGMDGQTTFENIEIIGNIYENPELIK